MSGQGIRHLCYYCQIMLSLRFDIHDEVNFFHINLQSHGWDDQLECMCFKQNIPQAAYLKAFINKYKEGCAAKLIKLRLSDPKSREITKIIIKCLKINVDELKCHNHC